MYIFDVNYTVNGEVYLKSYLLTQPEDGFRLKEQIQTLLHHEQQEPVEIISTDLEEL
ncbi:hypothetical protein QRE62_03390 (plasmid) [Bacillus mycoides]|uniref:hypothetical protein n=1 Tax=Bacillus TaxID=1386 RepID=UPI0013F5CD91|nr:MULTISPECIES: hypothetical protein [Bacillus]MDI6534984.1 hypothetical protein [Bacillus mycoides]WJE61791.1 hypothetical protein QRE64_30665 [Bacillus mycoides]WJE67732.1 hypothetical protein QRE63_32575 [Bacillus mycoides]WJE74061.1 hypothetical protein QRE62_03390 [Bacillus mycoides]